ncbi:hypothetical protein BHE74_00030456 [Ensete ventricosum]|nr:hypothetical protein BHE74_00030456 [Ensete ventricosum]
MLLHRNLHRVPWQTGRLTDLWNQRVSCCPKYPRDAIGPLLVPSILKVCSECRKCSDAR